MPFSGKDPEHPPPFHNTLSGRQPIGWPPHASDRICRQIAVLEAKNLVCRHALKAAASCAAAGEMISVNQIATVGFVGAFEKFGQDTQAVQHVVLRVELNRELQLVFGSDISGFLEILDCILN